MPYKRKYKKKKSRRRPRRYRRYAPLVSMGSPAGVPTQKVVSMRYADSNQITSTTGLLGVYNFCANGIVDPNISGTGHQPMGRDTMATLYNHYIVLGSKIRVRWASGAHSPGTNDVMVGVYLNDDNATSYSTFTSILEAKKGSYKLLHTQRNQIVTYCNYSPKKFFNIKDVRDNLDRFGAGISSDPSEKAVYILWAQSRDQTTTNTVNFVVEIDYLVSYSEPADLLPS